jgi:ABC-2 type transport system ATP-binding protein
MDEPVIEFVDIHKTFREGLRRRKKGVLTGLNLTVRQGEIIGFLGLNGTGKTTTMKILMGITKPDRGNVTLLGRNMPDLEILERVGYMPEKACYHQFLNGEELLHFHGRLVGISEGELRRRIRRLLEKVGLEDEAKRRLKSYSKGMLQRIGFAVALLTDPEVLILDEPLSGLDPGGRKIVKDSLAELRDRGSTIFFSSHILPDVEALCTGIAVLSEGKVSYAGTPEEILINDILTYEVQLSMDRRIDTSPLSTIALCTTRMSDTSVSLIVEGNVNKNAILRYAVEEGLDVRSVSRCRRSLEDILTETVRGR